MTPRRRLVITVCPREPGTVRLALERGGVARRLDAPAILDHFRAMVAARGVEERVTLRAACAGGCWLPGPNVSVTLHCLPEPGVRGDDVAIGWKSYVHSLADLDGLACVIDDNLGGPRARIRRGPGARSSRRGGRPPC